MNRTANIVILIVLAIFGFQSIVSQLQLSWTPKDVDAIRVLGAFGVGALGIVVALDKS